MTSTKQNRNASHARSGNRGRAAERRAVSRAAAAQAAGKPPQTHSKTGAGSTGQARRRTDRAADLEWRCLERGEWTIVAIALTLTLGDISDEETRLGLQRIIDDLMAQEPTV